MTVAALSLFGRLPRVSDARRDSWERKIARRGPSSRLDAWLALEYVGPVTDDVTEALDVDGNGVVDYRDVLLILENREDAPAPSAAAGRRRESIGSTHDF